MLASVDDLDEGVSILAHRASKEFPGGGSIWIGGEALDKCSVLVGFSTGGFYKSAKVCSEAYYAYCEFNGKLKFVIAISEYDKNLFYQQQQQHLVSFDEKYKFKISRI